MKKNLYIIIILQLGILPLLSGQVSTDSIPEIETGDIHLISKHTAKANILRWGYDDPALWYSSIKHGVRISRKQVLPEETSYSVLAEVKPASALELEQIALANPDNDMIFVVLQHTWKDWENTTMDKEVGSILEKESNFYSRWSLVHFAADRDSEAAIYAGLRYEDSEITPGVTYAYKIETLGDIFASDYKVISPVRSSFVPTLEEAFGKDLEIVIKWDREIHDYHYSGYFIERSEDGINFSRMNEVPYVQMVDVNMGGKLSYYTYIDSVGSDKTFYYRIRGMDAFGDISDASNVLTGQSEDRTPPPAPYLTRDDDKMTHMSRIISWTQSNPEEVYTYHLERKFGSNITIIENWAQPHDRMKVDVVEEEGFHTYRLIAEDSSGNRSYSNEFYTKLYDMEPPAIPTGLTAQTDTSGLITLLWDEHPERDVIGYYVYAADGRSRDMQRLTPEVYRSRIFFDTVNVEMLTQKRYYRVVAVDNDYMHSKFSDTLIVDRPDIIPPSPALIADYEVKTDGIELTLIPSSSRDVVEHRLYRKSSTDSLWVTLESFISWPGKYFDENVETGMTYSYKIIAIDEGGLESSVVKEVRLTAYNVNDSELNLSAQRRDDNKISLSWSGIEGAKKVLLFRSKNNGPYLTYKTLRGNINSYIDNNIKDNASYRYRIQTINTNGLRSKFSNQAKVEL